MNIKSFLTVSSVVISLLIYVSLIPLLSFIQISMFTAMILVTAVGIIKLKQNHEILLSKSHTATCKNEFKIVSDKHFLEKLLPDMLIDNSPDSQENNDMICILDAVKDFDCLLVYGGRGSGKTEFMRHYSHMKIKQGQDVLIIDPKPYFKKKWHTDIKVVGHGHNYKDIQQIAQYYDNQLEIRKADFNNINNYKTITIIVDELYLLNLKIDNFINMILPCLLEGREYKINLCLISQSKTAGSLGLKGHYDLLECFDAFIHLSRSGNKHDNNSYSAILETSEGKETYRLPGRYKSSCHEDTRHTAYKSFTASTDSSHEHQDKTVEYAQIAYDNLPEIEPEQQKRIYESKAEKIMCEMYQQSFSLNAIAKRIWGSSNGRRTKAIKAILAKHNIL